MSNDKQIWDASYSTKYRSHYVGPRSAHLLAHDMMIHYYPVTHMDAHMPVSSVYVGNEEWFTDSTHTASQAVIDHVN